jgi:hypothetical protein
MYMHKNMTVVVFAVQLFYSTIILYLYVNLPVPSSIDTATFWLHKTITKTQYKTNY